MKHSRRNSRGAGGGVAATRVRGEADAPAPGGPGAEATWRCAAKSGVGCALSPSSRVWFTTGRGVVNEVYHPWVDHAALGDCGLVVTDGEGFCSDEQGETVQEVRLERPGVPVYRLINTCKRGRYRVEKEILADPRRDVLLQRVRVTVPGGDLRRGGLRAYVVVHPRLGDQGGGNEGWVGHYKGRPMLMARRGEHALAVASSAGWGERSVGYVGRKRSDPVAALRRSGRLGRCYTRTDRPGNVALAGEVDLAGCGGEFVLAIGFDRSPAAAGLTATLSLMDGFGGAREQCLREWDEWQRGIEEVRREDGDDTERDAGGAARGWARPDRSRPAVPRDGRDPAPDVYRTSTMVLRAHRSGHFAGAGVASLSVPWGEARGDGDRAGYHVVWVRDLVEEVSGLLAVGAHEDARRALGYLMATQEADGHWPQDMWLEGTAYMRGVQMDEAGLPILLADLARRDGALGEEDVRSLWPMVRSAAGYIVGRGPQTEQDRWENTPGYSPFTLAVEVAALVTAAGMAEGVGEAGLGRRWLEVADEWNGSIERWTYVTGTRLARRAGVEGYYVRVAPPGGEARGSRGVREETAHGLAVTEVVSPDALALVRFGLRAADDRRVVNTVKAIDAATRVETPYGPCWRRYNGDYYGEHDDGAPFLGHGDVKGRGRAWPLLTGERGHYELAAGRAGEARRMLRAMRGFASAVGLLPEQVWDAGDLPGEGLWCGRPSGSAMPLAWAHVEYVRLVRSIRDGRVFDLPPQVYERYVDCRQRGRRGAGRVGNDGRDRQGRRGVCRNGSTEGSNEQGRDPIP